MHNWSLCKFFEKSIGAEIQAAQVAEVLGQEPDPLPEMRDPAPKGANALNGLLAHFITLNGLIVNSSTCSSSQRHILRPINAQFSKVTYWVRFLLSPALQVLFRCTKKYR